MASEPDYVTQAWTIRRGDDWRYEGTVTSGDVSGWDDSTIEVAIRLGPDETDTLWATSDPAQVVAYEPATEEDPEVPAVVLIDTSGTDLTDDPPLLSLHIEDADTPHIRIPGVLWIHGTIEMSGDRKTFLYRRVFGARRLVVDE